MPGKILNMGQGKLDRIFGSLIELFFRRLEFGLGHPQLGWSQILGIEFFQEPADCRVPIPPDFFDDRRYGLFYFLRTIRPVIQRLQLFQTPGLRTFYDFHTPKLLSRF